MPNDDEPDKLQRNRSGDRKSVYLKKTDFEKQVRTLLVEREEEKKLSIEKEEEKMRELVLEREQNEERLEQLKKQMSAAIDCC